MGLSFKEFRTKMNNHINEMIDNQGPLFTIDINTDDLYNQYLDSFPKGTNEIYRERREFDCSNCRNFVKNMGNVVTIKDNKLNTIWNFTTGDEKYQAVVDTMHKIVSEKYINNPYITNLGAFGAEVSHEELEDKSVKTWNHLYFKLPNNLINRSSESNDTIMARLRDSRNVFERSLKEITPDAVQEVLELISQNSLYKGNEWDEVLKQFQKLQKEYLKITEDHEKSNYCWAASMKVGPVISRIKNHSIGTLLMDLSEDLELEQALRKYESVVAPTNYKRPKIEYSKKQLEELKKELEAQGLLESLPRRFARISDITAPNTFYINRDVAKKLKDGDIFAEMSNTIGSDPKKFDKVEEVTIEKLLNDILPTATNFEILLESRITGNLVSLVTAVNEEAKNLFKWPNPFSWAYSGNITDSMKERVKAAGGKVDGELRCSLQWNDNGDNQNDFDLHCVEPNGNHIYFANKLNGRTGGILDVDIICPNATQIAVENITWSNRDKMTRGIYRFYVNNFNHRGGRSGFSAEVEFDGQIFSFDYPKELRHKQDVEVAQVELTKDGEFKMLTSLPSSSVSKDMWNLKTNQFVPVSICMMSPNYWDNNGNEGTGNKHYFFMLKDCINPENPNGFFNEFIKEDLMKYKRVIEDLGRKVAVADDTEQLSGVGFSSTKRSHFICKVEGKLTRTLKVTI